MAKKENTDAKRRFDLNLLRKLQNRIHYLQPEWIKKIAYYKGIY